MKNRAPKVSIGIPVYNGENYLAEALDSLLAQTYEDFELIISDNGSTDRTPEICRFYAANHRRIRFHRQLENRGAAWNYNYVFEQSRGEYFKWAAHDDICSPTFLAKCVAVLDNHPDVAWCHPRSIHIDQYCRPIPDVGYSVISYGSEGNNPSRESSHPHKRFHAVVLGAGGNKDTFGLVRSKILRKTALQLPYYGADKVLVAELALIGRFKEIPETLFFGRVHPDASGARPSIAQQQDFINPKGRRFMNCTRLQLLNGYISAIKRANLGLPESIRCCGVLVNYLLQVKKWREIAARTITRSGTGGGYLPALETMKNDIQAIPVPDDNSIDVESTVTARAQELPR